MSEASDAAETVLDGLRAGVAARSGVPEELVEGVFSPYRVCPIGAHVDHQHGPALALAIDIGTTLAFVPARDGRCSFASADQPGRAEFDVADPGAGRRDDWTRYPRAAAWALRHRLPTRPRGVTADLSGALAGGGLSSSASLILACVHALAEANELALVPEERVRLSLDAENGFVGLASGVLDPAAIVASKRGRITRIDTGALRWETIAPGPAAPPWRLVVAFSGRTRNLTATGFNQRVAECAAAARRLCELSDLPMAERLGEVPEPVIEQYIEALPTLPRRRARHFLEERRRVRTGTACWRAGDLAGFGEQMTDSCRSSIVNFETGSEELVQLHELLLAGGALGARFSGAGFAGCAIALVEAERAEACRAHVEAAFVPEHPGARVFLVADDDGVRRIG